MIDVNILKNGLNNGLNNDTNKILKEIIMISIPASIEMILQNIMGLVDMAFISRIGTHELAGISLINQISTLLIIIFGTLGVGGSILIAQSYGKKEYQKISQIITVLILIGGVVAILLAAGLVLFGDKMLVLMGAEAKVAIYGGMFLKIIAYSFIFTILSNFISAAIRAMGNTKNPLFANFTGVLLNTILNYIFIFQFHKGVTGAAYATLISRAVIFVLLVTYLLLLNHEIKFTKMSIIGLNRNIIGDIVKLTLPVLIGEAAWAIGSFSYTLWYTRLGTNELVANQIVFSIEEIFIMFSYGLTITGLTMVGQEIGRGNIKAMKEKARLIMKCGKWCGIIFGGLLFLFTLVFLTYVYPDINDVIARFATFALCFNAVYQFAKIANFILGNGILKGGGDTRNVMIIDVSVVIVGVITAFILGIVFNFGFFGVFFGKTLEEILRYILMYRRYKSDYWFKVLV